MLKTAKISTANTPYSGLLQRTSVDTANLTALGPAFCNMSIDNLCIYSFGPLEHMQQFPKSEYGLSKIRRFRKVWNAMPFYHRMVCILLNERLLQSKHF